MSPPSNQEITGSNRDTALLRTVIERIVSDSRGVSVRVDPRPLKADPAVVELTVGIAKAAPDLVRSIGEPLAPVSAEVVRARTRTLERMSVPLTDIFAYPSCPGILRPPELQRDSRPSPDCPHEEFVAVVLSPARPGGAYSPAMKTNRTDNAEPGVWSVRVIQRNLRPMGTSQMALDYVLRRTSSRTWQVINVVPLLIRE